MSAAQIVEQLRHLNNADRLEVIEAATRFIRADLVSKPSRTREDQDRRLRAAALAAKALYEPGGELTEWTCLDGEEVLDYDEGRSLAGEP